MSRVGPQLSGNKGLRVGKWGQGGGVYFVGGLSTWGEGGGSS